MVLAALVALAGLTACTGTTSPPRPDQTPDSHEQLVGVWSSSSPSIEGAIPRGAAPDGWLVRLRVRCAGSGELAIHVNADGFGLDERWQCTGRWQFSGGSFPPDRDPAGIQDIGPYTVAFDAADTVTSWDVEAYSTRIANGIRSGTSQSPA
jgi:hypothetical protein